MSTNATNGPCMDGVCVPLCVDSDGNADLLVQRDIPGETTGYELHAAGGTNATWKKISMVDGCKGNTLLLEYTCEQDKVRFHYLPCPAGTTCHGVMDVITGTYGAACVQDCAEGAHWMPLGLGNTLDVRALLPKGNTLCAGGLGGVRCLAAGSLMWVEKNEGFPLPSWLDLPLVTSLAMFQNESLAIMLNAKQGAVFRAPPMTPWSADGSAPATGQMLLATAQSLYLGGPSGATVYQPATGSWVPLGDNALFMTSLYHDGTTLFAGTDYGDVWWFDPYTNGWFPAMELVEGTVTTMTYYDTYFYVGTQGGLFRCWSESPFWGVKTYCEQIESETGLTSADTPEALHVHNGDLYVGTTNGVFRFDAAIDHWNPVQMGLMNAQTQTPYPVWALNTYQGHLIAGTSAGVYRLECADE